MTAQSRDDIQAVADSLVPGDFVTGVWDGGYGPLPFGPAKVTSVSTGALFAAHMILLRHPTRRIPLYLTALHKVAPPLPDEPTEAGQRVLDGHGDVLTRVEGVPGSLCWLTMTGELRSWTDICATGRVTLLRPELLWERS